MPSATMTSKGQIPVPEAVREYLGVGPGDRVGFRVREDGTVYMVAETVDLRTLVGSVRTAVHGVTVEEMNPGSADEAPAPGLAAR